MVIPNAQLKKLMESKIKEWDLSESWPINYVRAVTYSENENYPIVMLSFRPGSIAVDYFDGNQIKGGFVETLPKIGDMVFIQEFNEKEYLYVTGIAHHSGSTNVTIIVGKNRPEQSQPVYLTEVPDVNIQRIYDSVNVDTVGRVERIDRTLDVRVTNDYLSVNRFEGY